MVQQAQQAQKTRVGFEDKNYSGKREQLRQQYDNPCISLYRMKLEQVEAEDAEVGI